MCRSFFTEVNPHTLVEYLNLWFSRFHSYHHSKLQKTKPNLEQSLIYLDSEDSKHEKHHIKEEQQETITVHNYIVNHEINLNFSLSLKAMLEGLLEPIVKGGISFREMTANSLSFTFEIREE